VCEYVAGIHKKDGDTKKHDDVEVEFGESIITCRLSGGFSLGLRFQGYEIS
jgi:hypothetical protein